MRIVRNRIGLDNAAARNVVREGKTLDEHVEELHDTLEQAYWGDWDDDGVFIRGTGWRDGASRAWFGIDLYALAESEREPAYRELSGAVNSLHPILIFQENERLGVPNPDYETPRREGRVRVRGNPNLAKAFIQSIRPQFRGAILSEIARRGFPVSGVK